MRIRDLDIRPDGTPGPNNALTDVAGVLVGHHTLIRGEGVLRVGEGPVRTGVTAILPRGLDNTPVFAGGFSLNGNGELTGMHWVEESGFLHGPICLTNTHSIGAVHQASIEWMLARYGSSNLRWSLPVVGETYDGFLNDINGFHVKREHVFSALDGACDGTILEGNVGGGTGMICHGFKGGIGTASRRITTGTAVFTLAALVQANYGRRKGLSVLGVPVGKEISDLQAALVDKETGSIIVIVATDAPFLPHQLKRIARRVPMGISRVGGFAANGSGDLFVAFSTAKAGQSDREVLSLEMLTNDLMDDFFEATVQATEESILNALSMAQSMTGINNNRVFRLPHDRLLEAMEKYGP